MKVYIVTGGEYSDYHIEVVFLTYEQAVKYIELHQAENWCGLQIEEHEVDQTAPKTDKAMWCVTYKNRLWKAERTEAYCRGEPILHDTRFENDVFPFDTFYMTVFAKDKWQALKIAQDKYAKMKAESEGL